MSTSSSTTVDNCKEGTWPKFIPSPQLDEFVKLLILQLKRQEEPLTNEIYVMYVAIALSGSKLGWCLDLQSMVAKIQDHQESMALNPNLYDVINKLNHLHVRLDEAQVHNNTSTSQFSVETIVKGNLLMKSYEDPLGSPDGDLLVHEQIMISRLILLREKLKQCPDIWHPIKYRH